MKELFLENLAISSKNVEKIVLLTYIDAGPIDGDSNIEIHTGPRVIGGRFSQINAWPWMANLLYSDRPGCGGTLISVSYILTAAHCMFDFETSTRRNPDKIRLGEHDFKTINETVTQTFNVSWIIVHENYNLTTQENDIALIKLDRPARFDILI